MCLVRTVHTCVLLRSFFSAPVYVSSARALRAGFEVCTAFTLPPPLSAREKPLQAMRLLFSFYDALLVLQSILRIRIPVNRATSTVDIFQTKYTWSSDKTCGEWLKARMYVSYTKFGTNVTGNTRRHTFCFVAADTARKKTTDECPPERIYVRCRPQGIHVCCTPRHVSAVVTARDAFSTTGDKRVLPLPLGLRLWLNRPYKIVHTKTE